jgi:hypothetical protein
MKKILFILSALVIIASSCCQKKATANASAVEGEKMPMGAAMTNEPMQKINVNSEYVRKESTDNFTMLSKKVSGDTLWLEVQYGGGCEEHVFTVNTNMKWLKTSPPQLNLYVEHDSKNDMCRALVTKKIAFDLSSIKNASSKSIKLIIDGDAENKLTYSY